MSVFAATGVELRAADLIALRPNRRPDASDQSATPLPGASASNQRGQGVDLADIRSYAHGDDPRHVDPAATARTGELHVRQFHQDRDRSVILIADFRRPMLWGLRDKLRSHLAAEHLTREGWAAADRGDRVGLLVISGAGVSGEGALARHDQMVTVIRHLCEAHAKALTKPETPDLSPALTDAARAFPRLARLVIASGFDAPDPDLDSALDALRQRHKIDLHKVPHGLEGGLPSGHYPLRDGAIWSGDAKALHG